jgi:hypothetical protein
LVARIREDLQLPGLDGLQNTTQGNDAKQAQRIADGRHVVHVLFLVLQEDELTHQGAERDTQYTSDLSELVDPGRLPHALLDLRQSFGTVLDETGEHRLHVAPALAQRGGSLPAEFNAGS